jgi:hypothetical protein
MSEEIEVGSGSEKTFMSHEHLRTIELLKKLDIPYRVPYSKNMMEFRILIPENHYDKFRQAKMRSDLAPCSRCGK